MCKTDEKNRSLLFLLNTLYEVSELAYESRLDLLDLQNVRWLASTRHPLAYPHRFAMNLNILPEIL